MTIQFSVYDAANGGPAKRTGYAMSEASARAQAGAGERVELIGSDPATEIIPVTPIGVIPVPVPKLSMRVGSTTTKTNKTNMLANGVDTVTISSIPNGATCDIVLPADQGITPIGRITITDGSLAITTTVAGVYVFTLRFATYLDFVVTINAT